MNQTGDHFFASTRLALEKDGGLGCGDAHGRRHDTLPGRGRPTTPAATQSLCMSVELGSHGVMTTSRISHGRLNHRRGARAIARWYVRYQGVVDTFVL